jgi:hypothetical protein
MARVRRRLTAVLLAVAAPAALALLAQVAVAQTRRPGAPLPKPAPGARPTSPRDGGIAPGQLTPASGPTVVAPAATIPSDAGASVVESRTLDGGTHVFKFSELDIEGRLKSPQLVYFLRRVRAEFAAGELGHRTFMREMSETRKEPTF